MSSSTDLKLSLVSELGEDAWDKNWEAISQLSPQFFDASIKLSAIPKQKKRLPTKVQELISLAVDSSSTHLYLPGVQRHIISALKEGATPDEVFEVFELAGTLGIHACTVGVPILLEVMREKGLYLEHHMVGKELGERREKLKENFTKIRGYWHEMWEGLLALDPDFFEAYVGFSSVPWVKDIDGSGKGGGALEPKVKELIYCAVDAAATHLYVPGLKLHIRNALEYGASPEEVIEVFEIASQLGLHAAHASAPILAQILHQK